MRALLAVATIVKPGAVRLCSRRGCEGCPHERRTGCAEGTLNRGIWWCNHLTWGGGLSLHCAVTVPGCCGGFVPFLMPSATVLRFVPPVQQNRSWSVFQCLHPCFFEVRPFFVFSCCFVRQHLAVRYQPSVARDVGTESRGNWLFFPGCRSHSKTTSCTKLTQKRRC